MIRRFKTLVAVGAIAVVALSGCGGSGSGGSSTPNAAPTDKVLHLSFLQDPGQPPDPDIYYAGQGLLLTTNMIWVSPLRRDEMAGAPPPKFTGTMSRPPAIDFRSASSMELSPPDRFLAVFDVPFAAPPEVSVGVDSMVSVT